MYAGATGRKVLHVQSISSWAPSCIGPYSQATILHSLLHMAGQIGLDPPSMQLVSGGLHCQLIRYMYIYCCCLSKCSNKVLGCTGLVVRRQTFIDLFVPCIAACWCTLVLFFWFATVAD